MTCPSPPAFPPTPPPLLSGFPGPGLSARATAQAAPSLSDLNDLERAPEQLVRAARSPDPRLRKAAARALAEIHDPATVDVLIGLLSSDDRDTRLAIVEALGEIKSAKAQPGLLRALKDPDPEIRRAAAEALGEMREGKGTS